MSERFRTHARIEKDFAEIADCFLELQGLVIDQETKVIASEEASGDILDDVEKGNKNLDPAIDHARTRRRNQIRVAVIALVIVPVVLVVVVVVVKKLT